MSKVINAIREQYEAYRDVPEDELITAIGERYPVYLDEDPEFKTEFDTVSRRRRVRDVEEFKEDVNAVSGSTFGRALASGSLMMGASAARFGEILTAPFGDTRVRRKLRGIGDTLEEQRQAIPFEVEGIRDVKRPSDVAALAAKAVGELTPQIAAMLVPGAAAARVATTAPRLAAAAAAGTVALPLEAGGIFGEIRDTTGQDRPGLALAAGALAASLEVLMPARLIGRALDTLSGEPKRKLWRRVVGESLKAAAEGAMIEAPTEALQETISITANELADRTYDSVNSENAWRVLDAAIIGGIGGGFFGGGGGAIAGAGQRRQPGAPPPGAVPRGTAPVPPPSPPVQLPTGPVPPLPPPVPSEPPPITPEVTSAEQIPVPSAPDAGVQQPPRPPVGQAPRRRLPAPEDSQGVRPSGPRALIPSTVTPPETARTQAVEPAIDLDTAYRQAQSEIDAIEDDLEAKGIDPLRLADPNYRELLNEPGWQVMPPELIEAYRKRDAIGSQQLQQNISDLTSRLGKIGLTSPEIVEALDQFALDPSNTDAFGQYLAVEYAQKLSQRPNNKLAEGLAYGLAAIRGEQFDELRDVSKKTLRDAANVVMVVKDYFGVKQPATPPPQPPIAPVTFIGYQEVPGRPPFPLFNLTEPVQGQPVGSTVAGPTLEEMGYLLPEIPPFEPTPTPAPTPATTPEEEVIPSEEEGRQEEAQGVLTPPAAAEGAVAPAAPPREGLAADWTRVDTDADTGDTRYSDVLQAGDPNAILTAVRDRTSDPFYRQLAQKFLDLGLAPTVEFIPRDAAIARYPQIPVTAQGFYRRDESRILVFQETPYQEQVILHEFFHAATVAELSKENSPVTRELTELFRIASEQPSLSGAYGLTNVYEFVDEAFTNNGFRAALREIGAPLTLWQRFVRAIRSLFSLSENQETLLDRILRVGEQAFTSERPSPGAGLPSQLDPFSSRQAFEDYLRQPIIEPNVAAEMRTVAAAQSGLVPDRIAAQIAGLDPTDSIEGRQATLLEFVTRLHGLAPAQRIQAIVSDPTIPDSVKDAAVSLVLRQVEHVRNKANEYEIALDQAITRMQQLARTLGKYTRKEIERNTAAQIADNLLTAYRAYLTAQAATLPAGVNIQAQQAQLINRMASAIADWQQTPDAITTALQVIADNLQYIPLNQGADAVVAAVRDLNILQGRVSQEVIDLLTLPKPGGLSSVLAQLPDLIGTLQTLRRVAEQAEQYQKQIAVFEKLFALTGQTPTPVDLRRFSKQYLQWRTQQREASQVLAQFDKDYRESDEDVAVYGGTLAILSDLQNDPQFRDTYSRALDAGSVLYRDIAEADPDTRETLYVGPTSGRRYRVDLRPDKVYDDATVSQLSQLVDELNNYLSQPNLDPLLERTWTFRRDYIQRWLLFPQFGSTARAEIDIGGVRIKASPFELIRALMGNRIRSARTELEQMDFRAANEAIRWFQVADQTSVQLRQLRNDKTLGDAALNLAVNAALKSHGWTRERFVYWNRMVLNPIIASQQTTAQLRLREGRWINGHRITKEDMEVASLEKRFTNRTLAVTQKGAFRTPLQFFNPLQIEDRFAGLAIQRNAFGPGPMTMARNLSEWAREFVERWSSASEAGKRAMLRDGPDFQSAVMAYVLETNPELERTSPHLKYYQELAKLAADDAAYNFQSFNQLVNWIADRTVSDGLYATPVEAINQIIPGFIREIDAHVNAFRTIIAETQARPTTETPAAAMESASANNAFTKPRVRLVAPSSYFDYTLSTDVQRTGYLASGYQVFQLNQIRALEDLILGLKRKEREYQGRIEYAYSAGTPRRRAIRQIQQQSREEVQRGETRFTYKRLVEYIHNLEKITKDLTEMVIDQRDIMDSVVLYAMSRGQSTLSSALLANVQSLANNTLGGSITAQFLAQKHLGRAQLILTPLKSTKEMISGFMKRVLEAAPARSAVGAMIRSNIPGFREFATWLHDQQLEQIQLYHEAHQYGLVNPQDSSGRIQAAGQMKVTAGRVEMQEPGAMAATINTIESLPGIRHALYHLRDKSPRLADDTINMVNMQFTRKNTFLRLQKEAITAFQARERLGKSNDFTQEANLLHPGELGLREASGYRDLTANRQLFSSVGLLDEILLNYYQRWKAAPADQKSEVTLFEHPSDEAGVVFDMAAMTNMPTAGYTPPFMMGVGYKGVIKGLFWMFSHYPMRMGERFDRLIAIDSRDPRYRRAVHAGSAAIALIVVMAIAGMAARELGQEGVELLTGRATSQVRLKNILEDPSLDLVARYTGIAMASNLPYYGELVSRLLGNPAYRSWWDLTEMIPAAGLIKDAAITSQRIVQTGSPVYAATDFISRWFPPASIGLRVFPEFAGDVIARNSARALSSIAPRDMEMARDRMQGGIYRQTPATVSMRSLISAAHRGDIAGVRESFAQAVEERRQAGSPDPERATLQSLLSQTPTRRVFGRDITPEEESRLLARMTTSQRLDYEATRNAFALINNTLGTEVDFGQREVAASRPRARRTRRIRFGSRLPSIRRSRSRSPFSGLSIRGRTRRRRRRSPSLSF